MGMIPGACDYRQQQQRMAPLKSADGVCLIWDPAADEWIDPRSDGHRCGIYVVVCRVCGRRVGCTTAGRPDDPRSVKIACKIGGRVQ